VQVVLRWDLYVVRRRVESGVVQWCLLGCSCEIKGFQGDRQGTTEVGALARSRDNMLVRGIRRR
jgi:hypothetical protein